jgi:hypothetical protein
MEDSKENNKKKKKKYQKKTKNQILESNKINLRNNYN